MRDSKYSSVRFSTEASIDERTSDLEFPHTSPAHSTHELHASSAEPSSAETESTESKESAESTEEQSRFDESATRDQIVATQSRSPAQSNPCGGERQMILNSPPSSLASHRTCINKTHLRSEILPLKLLAENLYVSILKKTLSLMLWFFYFSDLFTYFD